MKPVAYRGTNHTLIRHDYKRACYRAMLSEFSPEDVIEFFSSEPLFMDGKQVKGQELYKLLWREKGKIPISWEWTTDNLFESFLIGKGRDVQRFLNKILWLNNKSTYIPGRVLLTWFYPKLEALFNSFDSRDMIFSFISLFIEKYLPGHILRRVKSWEDGESVKSIQVFITDTEFKEPCLWDYELIAKPQILNSPGMFGMPPFEEFGILSDTRHPAGILWDAGHVPQLSGGKFNIAGEVFGRVISFSGFCRSRNIDLSEFNPPDVEVVEITRDYHCPIRKRIVLFKGCVYGAPLYLNWVSHRKLNMHATGMLKGFMEDIEREEEIQDDELAKRHDAVMALASGKAAFAYYAADESMNLNGAHFTKNVPAKILKYLLESHQQSGKSEFEYRELKRIFEISQGQKNANFEVRFYRLVEKLKEECPAVWIEKRGRGKFSLIVSGELEYRAC